MQSITNREGTMSETPKIDRLADESLENWFERIAELERKGFVIAPGKNTSCTFPSKREKGYYCPVHGNH